MNLFTVMEKKYKVETKIRSNYETKLNTVLEILKDLMSQSFFVDCITSTQEANFDSTIEFITAVRNQVQPFEQVTISLDVIEKSKQEKQQEDEETWEQRLDLPM